MFDFFPFISDKNSSRNEMNMLSSLFNEDFINNIIGQVMKSDFINDLTNDLENEDNCNIEFKDYGGYYLIKGHLPGVSPKDVSIDFNENKAILTIKNKKVFSSSRNSILTVVQTSGNIIRTFDIEEVDATNLRASFNEELLIITIPKARKVLEEINPRIIDVDNYKVE